MDRRTLESAAAENAHLRGLYALPLGGLMILSALGNWEVGPLRNAWVFGGLALAILAPGLLLVRYYSERYGRATPSSQQQNKTVISAIISVAIVIGVSLLLSSRASWSLDLPVNPTAIALALVILLAYAMSVGVRSHHAVIFGALTLVGLLPVWGHQGAGSNAGLALAGVAVITAGVLDHRLLVRTFGPATVIEGEGTNAEA